MQKENLFFFSFPSESTFDRKVKVSENRAKYKEKHFFSFISEMRLIHTMMISPTILGGTSITWRKSTPYDEDRHLGMGACLHELTGNGS